MVTTGETTLLVDLDEQALHAMCDDDWEFESELLETFLNCQGPVIEEMTGAWQSRDLEVLRKVAHFTKGGARSIGGSRLAAVAESLECAASNGETDVIDNLVTEAEESYVRLKSLIQNRTKAA